VSETLLLHVDAASPVGAGGTTAIGVARASGEDALAPPALGPLVYVAVTTYAYCVPFERPVSV